MEQNQCLVLFSTGPDPPADVMAGPQQPVGAPRGLPAEGASRGSKDMGTHYTAKHMYFILGF